MTEERAHYTAGLDPDEDPPDWLQTFGMATPKRWAEASVHTFEGATFSVTVDGQFLHVQRGNTRETLDLGALRLCREVR